MRLCYQNITMGWRIGMKLLMYMVWVVILILLVFIAVLADGYTLFLVSIPVVMLAMLQCYEDNQ